MEGVGEGANIDINGGAGRLCFTWCLSSTKDHQQNPPSSTKDHHGETSLVIASVCLQHFYHHLFKIGKPIQRMQKYSSVGLCKHQLPHPIYWIYPPKYKILSNVDLHCSPLFSHHKNCCKLTQFLVHNFQATNCNNVQKIQIKRYSDLICLYSHFVVWWESPQSFEYLEKRSKTPVTEKIG